MAKKTWCVCGRETGAGETWEFLESGLASRKAAEEWLQQNHRDHPECVAFYVDPEDSGSGTAECYFERDTDGSLVRLVGCQVELFAE